MNNTHRFLWLAVPAASSFVVILFIAATTLSTNGIHQSAGNNYRLHKTLDAKALQQWLVKNKSGKLILDIYPVKQTPNANKKDFDVLVVPRNKDGKPFTQTHKGTFEKGSANYAHFLHQKNMAAGAVQLGYQATIDEQKLKKGTKVEIFIDAMQPVFNKLYFSTYGQGQRFYSDSAPIGKCPPCLFDPQMAEILTQEYEKPTRK
ncbi:hypothetical protein FAM09_16530 [Niastella caeni]|uniref:Uncharacterized protein n=1 Tax=Niastella caeni TaxID=2569763 RepID=A0A4S8HYG9_9BACT|nr:hypothetical protein [Niastella caeni]THU38282.1 hypothetical protein FAM09_16530 [Niastella caeni]